MDSIAVQKHELPPTNQKRMIAFINHFIVSTVTFLNKFASDCETRFVEYEHKMQNLEASLMIVEAKLASIDVLKKPPSNPAVPDQSQTESVPKTGEGVHDADVSETQMEAPSPPTETVQRDPQYDLYFKMLHLGVPLEAVKNKITIEGLDPNYIDQFL
ncbi:WASH complex subunit 3 [Anopheles ziemanni]|uniref:WASH complex subunit 3 n=1 Tax=Anopheles coustani TaxID=139045 RepID=UPI00265957C4|nr:WASH complex subunit 3 [Anopheles coustani]XP_058168431.1 WASH complex subunit 3 [Anopheles ziemanni]